MNARNNLLLILAVSFSATIYASQVDVVVDGRNFQCAQGSDAAEVTAKVFGELYSCRGDEQTPAAIISRRCECVDNNGPDLMQIGFSVPPVPRKMAHKNCWMEQRHWCLE